MDSQGDQMRSKRHRRSSILKVINPSSQEGAIDYESTTNTTKLPRRVSFAEMRFVQNFDKDVGNIQSPKQEPALIDSMNSGGSHMQISDMNTTVQSTATANETHGMDISDDGDDMQLSQSQHNLQPMFTVGPEDSEIPLASRLSMACVNDTMIAGPREMHDLDEFDEKTDNILETLCAASSTPLVQHEFRLPLRAQESHIAHEQHTKSNEEQGNSGHMHFSMDADKSMDVRKLMVNATTNRSVYMQIENEYSNNQTTNSRPASGLRDVSMSIAGVTMSQTNVPNETRNVMDSLLGGAVDSSHLSNIAEKTGNFMQDLLGAEIVNKSTVAQECNLGDKSDPLGIDEEMSLSQDSFVNNESSHFVQQICEQNCGPSLEDTKNLLMDLVGGDVKMSQSMSRDNISATNIQNQSDKMVDESSANPQNESNVENMRGGRTQTAVKSFLAEKSDLLMDEKFNSMTEVKATDVSEIVTNSPQSVPNENLPPAEAMSMQQISPAQRLRRKLRRSMDQSAYTSPLWDNSIMRETSSVLVDATIVSPTINTDSVTLPSMPQSSDESMTKELLNRTVDNTQTMRIKFLTDVHEFALLNEIHDPEFVNEARNKILINGQSQLGNSVKILTEKVETQLKYMMKSDPTTADLLIDGRLHTRPRYRSLCDACSAETETELLSFYKRLTRKVVDATKSHVQQMQNNRQIHDQHAQFIHMLPQLVNEADRIPEGDEEVTVNDVHQLNKLNQGRSVATQKLKKATAITWAKKIEERKKMGEWAHAERENCQQILQRHRLHAAQQHSLTQHNNSENDAPVMRYWRLDWQCNFQQEKLTNIVPKLIPGCDESVDSLMFPLVQMLTVDDCIAMKFITNKSNHRDQFHTLCRSLETVSLSLEQFFDTQISPAALVDPALNLRCDSPRSVIISMKLTKYKLPVVIKFHFEIQVQFDEQMKHSFQVNEIHISRGQKSVEDQKFEHSIVKQAKKLDELIEFVKYVQRKVMCYEV